MRSVGLAEAKAQLSALLDAVEMGDEVVITRRGQPVARLVREIPAPVEDAPTPWPERLRRFHDNQAPFPGDAVALVGELRRDRG
ncbi:type II toxin-antitoxin system prevent-host-death family antitoxin [Cyanobium gracile UHCC 0139]|uniref:Antitoxin n=1 Tax=Cyanobium gracile UHCC 0139 TaxID=3110308 RepID=A0ABU5RUJ3_9CYAN|nr:type II toxin-antitoxin system prevent-host-death family antitoxin [Cyanobium gracile]MEA5391433.1 type II toxin-antitoxin system prevent-host-death family antitoxin [Cyanobium gracile UHCC 0139]